MAKFYRQYSAQEDDVPSIDADIQKYIRHNSTDNYEEIIKNDGRWEVLFHLSDLRTSLFSWYDFKPDSTLLEVGGGFGALTGLFCKKCANVTVVERSLFRAEAIFERYVKEEQLEVYAGNMIDIEFKCKFDYIVLAGELEIIGKGDQNSKIYQRYLQQIRSLLKTTGVLLLAVENRYGLKYFCGAGEPYTGMPFAGINRCSQGTKGRVFSKNEITDILLDSGIENFKFYYPLPDYKMPQLIYSDKHLPEKNLNERLIPYYINGETLLADELSLYNDIIEHGKFDFFANSYLIECGRKEDVCPVMYAALSTDRGRDKAFATVIYDGGMVRKKPLYDEGIYAARLLYRNIKELRERGLPIVPHKWEQDALIMPYITGPTLSNHLKEIVKTDKQDFLRIMDQLYEWILSSSETVSSECNVLCNLETKHLDWGVILKKAYLELIPLNSFFVNGQILFFDQEFVTANFPAKYILFRALRNLYAFAPYIESFVPLRDLKEKYGLEELWDIFEIEDNRFLNTVRKYATYSQLYQPVNWQKMRRNAELLGNGEQVVFNYQVSEKMKKIWMVQLDILRVIKSVCERNGLKYFMMNGTLLGAVRHKGFIPWDDDIDIAMPRADYDKLQAIAATEFSEPYFLQMPENDPDCFYGGYCRLRNSDTTAIALQDIGHDCNQGIWIDILPLDEGVSDSEKWREKARRVKKAQRLLYAKVYGEDCDTFMNLDEEQWEGYCRQAKRFTHRQLCRRLQKALALYREKSSDFLTIFTLNAKPQRFPKKDFLSAVQLEFAGENFPAPIGYQRCLEISMGKDYMVYPPACERKPHHLGIYAPDIPYQHYNNLFANTFCDANDRIIVVFGAGAMFEDYWRKYGERYRPEFLVDNDREKWETTKKGIVIKNPQDLKNISVEKLCLIVCSVHYRQIEEQLKSMGIYEYRIYVQEKSWIVAAEEKGRSFS